jgi:hypothetical protein
MLLKPADLNGSWVFWPLRLRLHRLANHSIFAARDPMPKSAMLDGPCATFSHMFVGTQGTGQTKNRSVQQLKESNSF